MFRLAVVATCFLLLSGCDRTGDATPATASVPATDSLSRMVGKWGIGGEVCLIVSQTDDRISFSAPANETWRMDIRDAKVDGETVAFVQKNFLHNGESHPFNGVACQVTVRLIDSETMEMTLTTVDSPSLEPDLLSRIQ